MKTDVQKALNAIPSYIIKKSSNKLADKKIGQKNIETLLILFLWQCKNLM